MTYVGKVIYNGKEIELIDDLEEKKLDLDNESLTDLDDTLELDVNEIKRMSDEYE